jgi:hypothetical protein
MSNIHLIKVDWIKQIRDGEVLWEERDIYNVFHKRGEEFMLRALFTGGNTPNALIPDDYFFGLDNRTNVVADDDFVNILGEPFTGGYLRQSVSSLGEITVAEEDGAIRAITSIISFRASGGTWGPVKNLFMTDRGDNNGFLIASVAATAPFSVIDGDSVTMRMSIGLTNCETV